MAEAEKALAGFGEKADVLRQAARFVAERKTLRASMSTTGLRGVIAAAATPITADYRARPPRFVELCRRLLDTGCDGLNICGTTGEATSFTVAQRMAIMNAAAAALPLERLMVGTGAASIGDAIALTQARRRARLRRAR